MFIKTDIKDISKLKPEQEKTIKVPSVSAR